MSKQEKESLLSSSVDSMESSSRKFETFPTGGYVQIPGAMETGAISPRKRYRCDNFLPCDPRRWMHRFLVLILMCFLSFGEEVC